MPYVDAGVTLVDKKSFTVSLVAFGGDKTSVSLSDVDPTATAPQLVDFATKLGALTNAGVYGLITTTKQETSPTQAVMFDEAFASASMKAIFVFQDLTTLKSIQVGVPAPDDSIFDTDQVTVKGTPDVLAFILATQTVLNAGGADYTYVRGYRAGRTRIIPRSNVIGIKSEPGVGDKPGDAPAV